MKSGKLGILSLILLCVSFFGLILAGCGGEDPASTSVLTEISDTGKAGTTSASQTAAETTAPPVPGEVNYLTGIALSDGEESGARAYAVVINNIKVAEPYQAGTSKADVIFEYEVEGGITRLLALFLNPSDAAKLGPIRSARPVSVNIAMGFDAVFVHAGGSTEAIAMLSDYSYTHIDALSAGEVFYRDSAVSKAAGYEHSLFTTGQKLEKKGAAMKSSGARLTLKNGYETPFAFYDEDTVPGSAPAKKVITKYGSYQPYFEYDEAKKLYTRYEYSSVQKDSETNTALTFKNVIVLSVPSANSGDSSGHRNFEDVGSGTGIYATNGVSVPIKWSKASETAPLKLFTENGEVLKINRGQTFVSYVNGTANISAS
jgi:hypothetical protein